MADRNQSFLHSLSPLLNSQAIIFLQEHKLSIEKISSLTSSFWTQGQAFWNPAVDTKGGIAILFTPSLSPFLISEHVWIPGRVQMCILTYLVMRNSQVWSTSMRPMVPWKGRICGMNQQHSVRLIQEQTNGFLGDWSMVESIVDRYINPLHPTLASTLVGSELEAWSHFTIPLGLTDCLSTAQNQACNMSFTQSNNREPAHQARTRVDRFYISTAIAPWVVQVLHHSLLANFNHSQVQLLLSIPDVASMGKEWL